ncbi:MULTISPECIES: rhodanese-like domain-containing protein [unclassified Thermoactinomyces]|uniref:rhodanese-like domain-containing protein n=1 Tax=unclassified Thermoactinomyces TaxID=2634588 RepID=UPI0018DE264C|nr:MULTISPECIES: rhodanese-like domain-containing protein [unclassified Thermoactinomyces]MBH8598628.1 rhodanese-like domain-containing protein [Thermoactinomyces sp. CICC 10523]MBH8605116.1 rhodanese-like domain-containing protein [Thermoactinomyces sp. CICC 10522]MBH8609068.1 rhodanese-like domain-containing protein [Thermoactinomyces sp. CICC 10521]
MNSIFIGIIVLLGGILYFYLMNRGIQTISPSELLKLIENKKIHLLDVREKHEFQSGHIPGAINTPLSQIDSLKKRVAAWDKGENIYLYCRSSSRSAIAARQLRKLGFQQVIHLKGGLMNWKGPIKKVSKGGKDDAV